ncbi:MAG: hypothetical protein ACFFC3_16250, partial [Candidatus Odinarchaeota archaeon]
YLTFILNSCCIFLGVLYISFPIYSILWDYFGVILLITIFENLIMISINSIKERNNHFLFPKWNLLSYIYLIFIIIAIICMILGNLLISVTYSNRLIDNLGAYMLIYLFHFGIMAFGIFYAVFGIRISEQLFIFINL